MFIAHVILTKVKTSGNISAQNEANTGAINKDLNN